MDGLALAIFIILGSILVALFVLTFVPLYARWSAYRHSALIRLQLPSRLETIVSTRLMTRDRGAGIGGLTAILAALIVVNAGTGISENIELSFWFVAGAAVIGTSVGTAVAAFAGGPKIASDKPRVARSGAATVADYLVPFELMGARAVVALSLIATIIATIIATTVTASGTVGSLFPLVLLSLLGVASLVFFEIISRRIVDVSQPAGSTAELIWSDAIRASSLRDLLAAPLVLGAYSLIVAVAVLISGGSGPSTESVTGGAGIVAPLALIIYSFYNRTGRPQRYFLTRLWPNLRWSDTADAVTDAA